MKDIIIQKLKAIISDKVNQLADSFIVGKVPLLPSLKDYENLLSKVQSGEIEIK